VSRESYIWLGTEDALGENLTALFYGVAGVIIVISSIIYKVRSGLRWYNIALPLLLALFFVFIAGEEISWGQRILGLSTPETLKEQNIQGEINIHNLEFFSEYAGLLNQHTALNCFALMFGVLIPLGYYFSCSIRKVLKRIHFPIVPMSLCMFFVVGLAHGQTLAKLQVHWSHTEVKELIFSLGILLYSFYYSFNIRNYKKRTAELK
jgi:hypothetical protein